MNRKKGRIGGFQKISTIQNSDDEIENQIKQEQSSRMKYPTILQE